MLCVDNGHTKREKSIHYHNTDGKLLAQEHKLLGRGRKLWEFSACPSYLAFLLAGDRAWIKAQNSAVFFSQSQLGLVRQIPKLGPLGILGMLSADLDGA